jgi:hypothetical protein
MVQSFRRSRISVFSDREVPGGFALGPKCEELNESSPVNGVCGTGSDEISTKPFSYFGEDGLK